jgi:t-SNARE complex subunit (syntaxin)
VVKSTDAHRRRAAVEELGEQESESVYWVRSARVRRFAVISVALIIVVWAVRFIFAPIPPMPPG